MESNPLMQALNRTLKTKPSTRDLHKEVVNVQVSNVHSSETFVIHKQLLMYHSAYFRAALSALSTTSAHSNELAYRIPELEVFHWFEHWLYHSTLDSSCCDYPRVVCLYVFAEGIGCPELQNACLDRLFDDVVIEHKPLPCDAKVIHLVWNQTGECSPIRQLLLDLVAWNATEHEMLLHASGYPADFASRLLQICMARLSGGFSGVHRGPRVKGKASYHLVGGLKVEDRPYAA